MEDQIINYYEFPDRRPDWDELRQVFKQNVSKYGGPFFEAESELEREFFRFCERSGLKIAKRSIVEYGGKGSDGARFLFLCLKPDDGACVSPDATSFLELASACPGGRAFGLCGRGAKQIGRVPVKPEGLEQVTALGMLSASFPVAPKVILVSAAVADALIKANVTGCEILPTDAHGCNQLRIMVETSGPARVGSVRMGKRCPVCSVAKMFRSESERYFHTGDLKQIDFQSCRLYHGDNVGEFEINNGFPIVSQRIFDLLLSLKVKGLDRYSTDPPVQHAVVQICET